ncbi:MAG: substrate-binding domain-containing protein [Helicobacteraceae bacterium]|jgi:phosphate transport system substrate-binding protein|nr:substrate-binding domain-containing protein [Helicobacteraceae bacterium]
MSTNANDPSEKEPRPNPKKKSDRQEFVFSQKQSLCILAALVVALVVILDATLPYKVLFQAQIAVPNQLYIPHTPPKDDKPDKKEDDDRYLMPDLKISSATAFCPLFDPATKPLDAEGKYLLYEFNCRGTPTAYSSLTGTSDDLIVVFAPSNEQLAEAKERRREFELTPIGKEAFVFLVNKQNPIKSLTIEQIQKIYTGEITNWREAGGNDEEILAFQRNKNSGSQTAMENSVMKGLRLKEPLNNMRRSMSGMLYAVVADYNNSKSAIGYSFRFYVTDMQKAENVRLLAINGVEPTAENIRNGSYPLIHEFYIVGMKNYISENAKKLIDWFLSDQGQKHIEKVGYVPIN